MDQIPTKRILKLLDPDHPPEVRSAAALVLGEVGVRGADVGRALLDCLEADAPAVRLQAIRAAGRLRIGEALPRLLDRIRAGGEESHAAAEAAAHLGPKAGKALHELLPRVGAGVRRTIAAALAGEGAAGGGDDPLSVVLDHDPAVVEGATQFLGQIPTFDAKHRALVAPLTKWLGNKKVVLQPVNELAVLRLLSALGDEKAAGLFWDRIVPPHRAEVRALALQALGTWIDKPNPDQVRRLLTCAADGDFRLAMPALMILKRLPVADKALSQWLTLFDAPDVMSRQLALEKLGGFDRADVAAGLMKQLRHADRSLRDSALNTLAKLKSGRKALTESLLAAELPDQAWTLARAQAGLAKSYPAGWRDAVFGKACAYLDADDRRADAFLFLLRETDAHDLRDRLEERALHWRKKKDYAQALHYLRLLTRDPACAFAVRLEAALCGLKVSAQELSAEARQNDPCLQQFVRLVQMDDGAIVAELEKAKWLTPDDLFYLGFHLAEQEGRPKKCAAAVLKLVGKRSPKSKLAQAAKVKLKGSGLD